MASIQRMGRQHFVAFFAIAVTAIWGLGRAVAQPPFGAPSGGPAGVSTNLPAAYQGYTLVAPMNSTTTYLIDLEGRIVNQWESDYTPALSTYLLENGHLLKPCVNRGANIFDIPAVGGRIQEYDWEGNIVWDFVLEMEGVTPHHDICPMPNGNVLCVATLLKTKDEVVAIGRHPDSIVNRLLVDCVLEIKPTGPNSGEVVWEWYAWDHLIQDTDSNLAKYGEVFEHPELIDVNYGSNAFAALTADPEELARLRTLGYVGGGRPQGADDEADDAPDRSGPGGPPRGPGIDGDWMHTNSIAYNANLDQIMLSVHGFSEVWIIDHSTTTAEAATHEGGNCGQGGDLLYRWGNPQAYRSGSNVDQRLYGQHCAHWIAEGLPGAGNMLVFNNGLGRPDGGYSSIEEVVLPQNEDGTYDREEFLAFGPEQPSWKYTAANKPDFYSMLISGAHRLANGNTMICSGNPGILFEVTADMETVWKYQHPNMQGGFSPGGFGPGGFGGLHTATRLVRSSLHSSQGCCSSRMKQRESVCSRAGRNLSRSSMRF